MEGKKKGRTFFVVTFFLLFLIFQPMIQRPPQRLLSSVGACRSSTRRCVGLESEEREREREREREKRETKEKSELETEENSISGKGTPEFFFFSPLPLPLLLLLRLLLFLRLLFFPSSLSSFISIVVRQKC